MRIKVTPEGRKGVWLADQDSVVEFLENLKLSKIHSFITGPMMFGADCKKEFAIDAVKKSDKLAVLTGSALQNNMRHALSVITNNKLEMFDIGEIREDDLIVEGVK